MGADGPESAVEAEATGVLSGAPVFCCGAACAVCEGGVAGLVEDPGVREVLPLAAFLPPLPFAPPADDPAAPPPPPLPDADRNTTSEQE